MSYAYTALRNQTQDVGGHGTATSSLKQERAFLNRCVREVNNRVDLRTTKRRSQLSPSLYKQIYQYTKPTDMKGLGLIDIMPQINRSQGHSGEWVLTSPEEFDRMKSVYRLVAAVYDADTVGKLWLSAVIADDKATIHECDSLTADGTWAAVVGSDASTLTLDKYDYVNGSASIKFSVGTTGTTPSIQVTGMTEKDLTDYQGREIFVWIKIPSGAAASMTSFTLRWGSSTSAYYYRTATTTNEGLAFVDGWNLVRFDWDTSSSSSGSPDVTAINHVRLIINLSGALGSATTDWHIDFIVARSGVIHDVIYYSKYGWRTSTGTWLENSTADTDVLNADTDEVDLISAYVDYMFARALKNKDEIKIAWEHYLNQENNYRLKYPSEAKPLTTSYYNLPSLGESVALNEEIESDTL